MLKYTAIYCAAILLLVLFRVSILGILPFFGLINFAPLLIIYISAKNHPHYFHLAVFAGYILDVYSSCAFGVNIAAMIAVAVFNNYVYFNILSNRRILSLAVLIAADILVFRLVTNLAIQFLIFLKISPRTDLWNIAAAEGVATEIAATMFLLFFGYAVLRATNKKMNKIFFRTSGL